MIANRSDIEKLAKGYIIILREATSYKAEYENQLLLTKKALAGD